MKLLVDGLEQSWTAVNLDACPDDALRKGILNPPGLPASLYHFRFFVEPTAKLRDATFSTENRVTDHSLAPPLAAAPAHRSAARLKAARNSGPHAAEGGSTWICAHPVE